MALVLLVTMQTSTCNTVLPGIEKIYTSTRTVYESSKVKQRNGPCIDVEGFLHIVQSAEAASAMRLTHLGWPGAYALYYLRADSKEPR